MRLSPVGYASCVSGLAVLVTSALFQEEKFAENSDLAYLRDHSEAVSYADISICCSLPRVCSLCPQQASSIH